MIRVDKDGIIIDPEDTMELAQDLAAILCLTATIFKEVAPKEDAIKTLAIAVETALRFHHHKGNLEEGHILTEGLIRGVENFAKEETHEN